MEPALNNIISFENIQQEQQDTMLPLESTLDAAIGWRRIEGKGRGVFARRDIRKGEVIERAPVVPVGKDDIPESGGAPDGYLLDWRDDIEGEEHALVLGYVMLYNHGTNPNVHLDSDFDNELVEVIAVRDIAAGEELTWDYQCELWFDPA